MIVADLRTLEEVGLQEDIENVARKTLDRVVEGEDVYPLAVLDVVACMYAYEVAELDAQVIPCDLVELDAALLNIVRADTDQDCILALLSPVSSLVRSVV